LDPATDMMLRLVLNNLPRLIRGSWTCRYELSFHSSRMKAKASDGKDSESIVSWCVDLWAIQFSLFDPLERLDTHGRSEHTAQVAPVLLKENFADSEDTEPITPRGFLHWCKIDSAFYRWNFSINQRLCGMIWESSEIHWW
jgi:hypothetical protein